MNRFKAISKLVEKWDKNLNIRVNLCWYKDICDLEVRYSDMSGTTWDTEFSSLTDKEILHCYDLGVEDR